MSPAPDPGSRSLPALLDSLAARHGGREALISARGRLSFADLAALADRVAGALAARGVRRGTHVALLLPNWPEWLAIAFGVWRCGGVLVPLNTLYRPREIGHALAHAEVALLIAARGFLRHDYAASLAELGIVPDRGDVRAAGFPALRDVVLLDPAAPLDLAAAPRAIRRPGLGPGSRRCRDHRLHLGLDGVAQGRRAHACGALPGRRRRRHGPRHRARRPHLGISAVLLRGRSGGGGARHAVARRGGGAAGRIRAGRDAAPPRGGAGQRVLRLAPPGGGPDRAPALRGDAARSLQGCRSEHEVGRRALRRESSCRRLVRHDGDPATLHGVAVGRAAGAPHGRPRNTRGSARAAHRGPRRRGGARPGRGRRDLRPRTRAARRLLGRAPWSVPRSRRVLPHRRSRTDRRRRRAALRRPAEGRHQDRGRQRRGGGGGGRPARASGRRGGARGRRSRTRFAARTSPRSSS